MFDDDDGVMRFENYSGKETQHNRTAHDGKLTASADEVKDNYQMIRKQQYNSKKHARAPTMAKLGHKGGAVAAAVAGSADEPAEKTLKRNSSDASTDSASSESVAPLDATARSSKPLAKPKAKAKAKLSNK